MLDGHINTAKFIVSYPAVFESQRDAIVQNLLSTDAITNIGTWNIWTTFETDGTSFCKEEMI